MASYEVKNLSVKSLIKNVPVVFAILGAVIGIFTFFLFPTDIARDLAFGAKLLSWLIFIVLYTLIMAVGIGLVAVVYNWVVGKVGGIVIDIEQKEE
ncbi:MAG: hypothetical protein JW803_00100 [Endomicrobiales bacterium]|nr:hypothetical protein [Endomicrobiales bacterium]